MTDIYTAGAKFNALCERVNGLSVWSMCYRNHHEYWLYSDARNEFYGELNRAATLLVDWHKDHADWRFAKVERSIEQAERLWEAERQRVVERRSPTFKRLQARLVQIGQTPIVWENGVESWVGGTDELYEAQTALDHFDYARTEQLAEKAERKARAMVLRAERARRRFQADAEAANS
jgi:hypothetical protein